MICSFTYFSAGEVWFTDPACRYELNSTSLKLSTEFLGFENIRKFSETSLRLCEHSLTHCFAEFINDDVIVINPSWCWWWFMIPKFCVCKICGYASTCVVKLQNYTLPCDFVIFVKIAYFGIFAFFAKNTKKHDFSSVQISQQTPVCFSPNYVLFSTPPPPVNGVPRGGSKYPKMLTRQNCVQFCACV